MVIFDSSIDPLIRALFAIHILGGIVALLIFLLPLVSKKGGRVHIVSGWTYSYAMVAVAFAAFPITIWRMILDPKRSESSQSFAAFLFFIAILSLASVWQGLRVLKFKKRAAKDLQFKNIFLSLLLILCGIGTVGLGLRLEKNLLIFFPIVGFLTATSQIRYWSQPPTTKMHWWYEHMRSMFAACIATVTAFLVTAMPRLVPSLSFSSLIVWFLPTIVLVPILIVWIKKYRRQFGDL